MTPDFVTAQFFTLFSDKSDIKKLATDAMFKLEHGVEDKAKQKKVIPGIAEIAEAQSSKKDDYMLNRIARNMFRVYVQLYYSRKCRNVERYTFIARTMYTQPGFVFLTLQNSKH